MNRLENAIKRNIGKALLSTILYGVVIPALCVTALGILYISIVGIVALIKMLFNLDFNIWISSMYITILIIAVNTIKNGFKIRMDLKA